MEENVESRVVGANACCQGSCSGDTKSLSDSGDIVKTEPGWDEAHGGERKQGHPKFPGSHKGWGGVPSTELTKNRWVRFVGWGIRRTEGLGACRVQGA